MKCIACGRDMLYKGTHFECPNILCDYEEEIEIKKAPVKRKKELQGVIFSKPVAA